MVEGGAKALKRYKKLMLQRIDWKMKYERIVREGEEDLGEEQEDECVTATHAHCSCCRCCLAFAQLLLCICLCKCVSAAACAASLTTSPTFPDFCGVGAGAGRRSRSVCRTAASWSGRASSSARHSTTSGPRTATPPPWPCAAPAKTSNPETTAHKQATRARRQGTAGPDPRVVWLLGCAQRKFLTTHGVAHYWDMAMTLHGEDAGGEPA
eukprot:COSAG04_NODE_8522_length_962_cov_770.402086_1_plen_210_part_00